MYYRHCGVVAEFDDTLEDPFNDPQQLALVLRDLRVLSQNKEFSPVPDATGRRPSQRRRGPMKIWYLPY